MGETGSIRRSKSQVWLVIAIVLGSLIIDQAIKLYIATHFALGESHEVTSWFWLCFVENNGMAFGIEWFSKLALTLFRLLAVGLLGWYIHTLIYKQKAKTGYIATIAFIIAGALGNIIDCVFYGKLFGVLFFRPVFNFADSCITCAVAVILLLYMKELNKDAGVKNQDKNEAQ